MASIVGSRKSPRLSKVRDESWPADACIYMKTKAMSGDFREITALCIDRTGGDLEFMPEAQPFATAAVLVDHFESPRSRLFEDPDTCKKAKEDMEVEIDGERIAVEKGQPIPGTGTILQLEGDPSQRLATLEAALPLEVVQIVKEKADELNADPLVPKKPASASANESTPA